jgi:uncharacterized membrane protein YdjX (TVP38/TMEM64 family)
MSSSRWRLVALGFVVVVLALLGRMTDVSAETVRRSVEGAGVAGVVTFVGFFVVGELLHVPGLVFVGAAVGVWGAGRGGAVAGVGSLVSLATSFVFVRSIGGKPLGEVRWEFARRLLARLEQRPVLTIAALRTILILSPPVTYALALSNVKFRDYMIGSAIGLVLPLSIAVIVFSSLLGS